VNQTATHDAEQEIDQSRPALQRIPSLDAQSLIKQALENGSPVEVLKELFELGKQVHAERARIAWYDAMAAFQERMPVVRKNRRADAGKYTWDYATLDEITGAIMPVMGPLGLSVSYEVRHEPNMVVVEAIVSHAMGHFRKSGEIPVPIVGQSNEGHGAMGANPAQRIGIAISYGKRYALLSITGIAPEGDDDGGAGATDQTGVRQPQRASGAADFPNPWVGVIDKVEVDVKKGKGASGPWSLSIIHAGGERFGTFSSTHVKFAMEAGRGPVAISWELSAKGMMVRNITREPVIRG
jgi:ERF superfamily protein